MPNVAAATAYIRNHLAEDVSVGMLAKSVGTSRRGLERRFREHLGRTVLHEIRRARIERAKQLLAETDIPIRIVAQRSGFSNRQRLTVIFHRVTGVPPALFRRRCRMPR